MDVKEGWRISLQGWLSLFFLGLAFWLTTLYGGVIVEVIGVIFGALLVSLALRPMVELLGRLHVPATISVILAYLGIASLIALIGDLIEPILSREVLNLQMITPTQVENTITQLTSVPFFGSLLPPPATIAANLTQSLDSLVRTLFDALTGLGSLALDILIVLILAYFLSVEPRMIERALLAWSPTPYKRQIRLMYQRLRQRLSRWIWAQIVIALYFSLAFSLSLMILRIPFALTIGLIGGLLELIPYVGGLVALCLALLSAASIHPFLLIWVIVIYSIVTEIESHIVAPTLYGRFTGLHPGAVLIILLIGAKVGGLAGLFFAVPGALVILAIFKEAQFLRMTEDPSASL
jgi:predicted PurR-regulated permease PerM